MPTDDDKPKRRVKKDEPESDEERRLRREDPFIGKLREAAEARDTANRPRHDLKFPNVVENTGPPVVDTRQAAVLLELSHFVRLSNIPRSKANAAADLLVRALSWDHQWLWDRVMAGLATMSAVKGWYNERVSDVLISEQQAKARLENLAAMGPRSRDRDAKEAPAGAGE